MHAGVVIVLIMIFRALMKWGGQAGRSVEGGGATIFNQEISLRFVSLSVFFIWAYFCLAFSISAGLEQILAPVRITWLQELLHVTGTGLLPLVILRSTPPWLAWRICRPLRLSFLCRFFFWFTPGADVRELENFAILFRAAKGIAPMPLPEERNGRKEIVLRFFHLKRKPQPFSADAWMVAAWALAAEVQGDHGRAERLLHTFELCPPGLKISSILRRFAFEELAWQAAKRGDWQAVRHRARLGLGRGMPLLKLLAKRHLDNRLNRGLLWPAWLISPSRIKALPFVLAAVKMDTASGAEGNKYFWQELDGGPRHTHLSLLFKASEGAPIAMEEVFQLAGIWEGELNRQGEGNLLRRGMELGARDVLGITGKIRDSLLDEMEEIASAAEGKIPEDVFEAGGEGELSCAANLAFRLRNRLYDDVYRAQELFHVEEDEPLTDEDIMEYWEIWLDLHKAASRLHRLLGAGELATLWYGDLRYIAWNSASHIYNSCRNRSAWISILMFHWVAEICELVGDEEGMAANRNNMEICGYSPPLLQRLLCRMSFLRRFLVWFRGGKRGVCP